MADRGTRPWLPGSDPMPEPFIWADDSPYVDARAPPPSGYYTKGLPQNIVNSLYSCVEGENRETAIRNEYYAVHVMVPVPIITTLAPPDAVASGTAPIMLQVNGADFQDNSKVYFNGVVQPTMYYSATKLVGEVQKLAIGYYPVLVKTFDKASNVLQFRFR